MTVKYSDSQKKAIYGRGSSLLISAGAGSGKTSVIVERLLDRVCGSGPVCSIEDFLVITFTKAAASELRSRIFLSLNDKIAKDPSNIWLRRLAAICHSAKISTIHSFCSAILREYANILGISSDFRVADQAESGVIMAQVLEKVVDRQYENIENNEAFSQLVSLLTSGRSDDKLVDTIRYIHEKLQSHPYPDKWVKEQLLQKYDYLDLRETSWGKLILEKAENTAAYWEEQIRKAYKEAEKYSEFFEAYGGCFAELIDKLSMFSRCCRVSWDLAVENSNFSTKAGRISGFD